MTRPTRWTLALAIALALTACAPDAGGRRFASIGTGGTGGIYYPLGGALARMLGEALPEVTFTAEVSGGSVENLNRVAAGEIDLGLAIGTTLAKAIAGPEAPRYADVRIAAPLYPNTTHVLVGPGTGIATFADLRGRRVSIGAAGSGTEQLARDLFEAAGIGTGDIDARYLSFGESSSALRDGAIDAAILSVGFPAAAVLEATTTSDARLLPLDRALIDAVTERFPYYEPATIPADAYPGVAAVIPTVAVRNWVIATASLDPPIVDALIDILVSRRDELIRVNGIARQIDPTATGRAPMPLHDATRARSDSSRD
jgi:TRAP transporter TAXI family solute receptor